MTQQPKFDFLPPPPVVSGIQSPFMSSLPIELQNITKNPPPPRAPIDADIARTAPWTFEGYKEFCKWMASDDESFAFRRFQALNARAILYMQDRISQIENRLEQIHMENAYANPDTHRRNFSFRWDMHWEKERDRLTCELTGLLHHYSK